MMKSILAAAAMSAMALAANAGVVGSTANQSPASFIDLSSPLAATVVGGALYVGAPQTNAAIPFNAAPLKTTVGTWLAAGPSHGNNAATVTFAAPTAFASFLWGSPDTYNGLTVTTTLGSTSFVATDFLAAGLVLGNQSFASYVGFSTTTAGELIKSLTFTSSGNAFEASNFSVTTPVPEPETYALLLAGLGVVGFMARRRKSV